MHSRMLHQYCCWEMEEEGLRLLEDWDDIDILYNDGAIIRLIITYNQVNLLKSVLDYFEKSHLAKESKYVEAHRKLIEILDDASDGVVDSMSEMRAIIAKYSGSDIARLDDFDDEEDAHNDEVFNEKVTSESVSYKSDSLRVGSTASSPVFEPVAVFNPDVLAKLLANNVLSIKNDRENAEFSIDIDHTKWCELSPEYRKEIQGFFKRLLQEFEEFKNQLDPSDKKKCICSVKSDPQDEKNILSFNIKILDRSLKLYDKFILQLTDAIKSLGKDKPSMNLIATLLHDESKVSNDDKEKAKLGFRQFTDNNENQHIPDIQQDNMVSTKRKTPLPTKPMPKGAKKLDDIGLDLFHSEYEY